VSGQKRRLVVLDDEPGIYRLSDDRPQRTLYVDAREGADLAVTCVCAPADECALYGQWNPLLAPVALLPHGDARPRAFGRLERGRLHLFLIADPRSEHISGTWLLHRATDLVPVGEADVPRVLPYIGGAR